jgi:hypothetical protein
MFLGRVSKDLKFAYKFSYPIEDANKTQLNNKTRKSMELQAHDVMSTINDVACHILFLVLCCHITFIFNIVTRENYASVEILLKNHFLPSDRDGITWYISWVRMLVQCAKSHSFLITLLKKAMRRSKVLLRAVNK